MWLAFSSLKENVNHSTKMQCGDDSTAIFCFSIYSQWVSNLEPRVYIKQSCFFSVRSSAVQLYCDTVRTIYRVSNQSVTVLQQKHQL